MASNDETPTPDLASRTDTLLRAADSGAGEAMDELSFLARARLAGAVRGRRLRIAEGGAPAEVSRVIAARDRVVAAAVAAERARVPDVSVGARQAVLHGRVAGARGSGKEGVRVTVLDLWGRELARGKTGRVGYFRFTFPPEVPTACAPSADERRSGRAEAAGEAVAPSDSHGPGHETRAVAEQFTQGEQDLSAQARQAGGACALEVCVRLDARGADGEVLARAEVTLTLGKVVYHELRVKIP